MKLLNQEMLLEAGVRIVFHAWAARPIVEHGTAKGVIFESKAGRQAIMAKVVVDTTGDGDMFARAGAEFDTDIEEGDVHHSMNTGWVLGGVDMDRWINWKVLYPEQLRDFMEKGRKELGFFQTPYVSWRPDIALFLGPRQSGLSALDVDDMTEVEIRSHRLMEGHCQFFRQNAPGFENVYSLQSASQLGVRHTRRMAGVERIERERLVGSGARGDRGRRQPLDQPEIPGRLGALRQPRTEEPRRDARGRAAHELRRQQPRFHARDPAVLADRPCRRSRRGSGRQPRRAAPRGRCRRGAQASCAGKAPTCTTMPLWRRRDTARRSRRSSPSQAASALEAVLAAQLGIAEIHDDRAASDFPFAVFARVPVLVAADREHFGTLLAVADQRRDVSSCPSPRRRQSLSITVFVIRWRIRKVVVPSGSRTANRS